MSSSLRGESATQTNGVAGPVAATAPSADGAPDAPATAPEKGDKDAAPGGDARPEGAPARKRARGQNKARAFAKTGDQVSLCSQLARGDTCSYGDRYVASSPLSKLTCSCRFGHDLCAYLEHKPADLHRLPMPTADGSLAGLEPAEREAYIERVYEHAVARDIPSPDHDAGAERGSASDPVQRGLDFATHCPYFELRGACPVGWRCRFLGAHVRRVSASQREQGAAESAGALGTGLELVRDEERVARWLARPRLHVNPTHPENNEVNWIAPAQARLLRSHKYPFERAPAILACLRREAEALNKLSPEEALRTPIGKGPLRVDYEREAAIARATERPPDTASEEQLEEYANSLRNVRLLEADAGADAAADTARVRACEKRRLDWRGALYLAPLTTTGNLPFRRVCASFGSDIHCGEMGLAESYLSGQMSEWSLTRRWEGERVFGTQVCGSKPEVLVPAAEALAREVGDSLDFVDVNCGCPIDLVYNRGAGSALLDHGGKLGRIARGMSAALGEVPLTIKLRTGTSAKRTAHKLFLRAQTEWGVGAITLHGRSRKQRYKNDADWAYVGECVDTLREAVRVWNEESRGADAPEMQPIPIYGNGDVFGWRDYYEHLEHARVDGEMIARGALIKPWIFTEIRERRDWDISSRERLDMVRQYAEYGLTHWGSDTQGVNTTRRFLCEMLSFTHRYVPVGLLDHVPIRMNDRPPPFGGRDPLESLLSSPSARDWVRISEMFLGKAPDDWHFTPKHKSNSFAEGGDDQQG